MSETQGAPAGATPHDATGGKPGGAARRFGVTDALLLAAGILFVAGILTFFKGCGPTDEGAWMTCHWAGQAVAGVAAAILLTAVAHAAVRDAGVKAGLSVASVILAALAVAIPGHLIPLCMMGGMRCRAVMTPGTVVMAALVVAAAAADIAVQSRRLGRAGGRRAAR